MWPCTSRTPATTTCTLTSGVDRQISFPPLLSPFIRRHICFGQTSVLASVKRFVSHDAGFRSPESPAVVISLIVWLIKSNCFLPLYLLPHAQYRIRFSLFDRDRDITSFYCPQPCGSSPPSLRSPSPCCLRLPLRRISRSKSPDRRNVRARLRRATKCR